MKGILLVLGIIGLICVVPVQAQTTSEFGYQLHPEKLLENTEGTLQIFVTSNDMMVPKQIENLKAISSDNSIIEILSIEDGNDKFTKNVIIKAKKPGITSIALAAPGFSSKEISLQVYNSNNYPTQILMKVTPQEFPIDGPKYGHIGIELATTGGLPTISTEDVVIHLDTPNEDVIKLKNNELIIKNGEYYTLTEFDIVGSGDAIIFAETEGMKKISSIVNVLEPTKPLQLQLYAYPKNFNSFSGSTGYAIVQLLDGDGEPVLAEEDIYFKLGVENPDISKNTSHDFDEIVFDKNQLVIEKGTYSAFSKFSPRPNLGDFTSTNTQVYNLYISADNYLTNGDSITIIHEEEGALEGEGPSITETIPFLTTGKQEIIAVTYYETDIEISRKTGGSTAGSTNRELVTITVPVQAKTDHKVLFSSSELGTVDPIDPIMKTGENAVIVYGQTGTVAPEDSVSLYITDNEGVKTATGLPIGPVEDNIMITVEPLIPMVLAENTFPAVAYMIEEEDEDEVVTVVEGEEEMVNPRIGITPFIEDAVLTFSANEFIETDSLTIKRNQSYGLLDMFSNEVGITTLEYQISGFEGTADIKSHTTDPAEIYLSFPENILANSKTLATVQLLDSAGNPVYAKEDIQIKLVSNDEQILKIPEELIIENKNYFTTFELETMNEGTIELALLSEDFALSKYDINVIDITPVLSLDLLGGMNWNERIEAKVSVTIPSIKTSLNGFEVEWETDGGEVRSIEEVTNNQGIATLNIIANDKPTVTITAKISGNGLSPATITKTATILNMPIVETEEIEESGMDLGLPIDTNMMIFIIIPVGIGAAIFMLKRMDKLDMITQKIPIADKINIGDHIEGIKERISDIKNR